MCKMDNARECDVCKSKDPKDEWWFVESGDVVIDHSQGEATVRLDQQKEVDLHLVRGHCVVIAARCHWFCRALLSGMREAIDK